MNVILETRIKVGMTRQQFADLVGVHYNRIGLWESGKGLAQHGKLLEVVRSPEKYALPEEKRVINENGNIKQSLTHGQNKD